MPSLENWELETCIHALLTIHLMMTGLPSSRGTSQYSSGGSRDGGGGAEEKNFKNKCPPIHVIVLTSGIYVDY